MDKSVADEIRKRLKLSLEFKVEKEKGHVLIKVKEFKQTITVPIQEIAKVLNNDEELINLVVKKIRSTVFN
jgi:hypothetical protein